jgi:septal ring factor EnvC (AmiA/AmiB activator)
LFFLFFPIFSYFFLFFLIFYFFSFFSLYNQVKDLNSQLIECLEQLYQREEELEDQRNTVNSLEENLIFIKQQMATVYYDFSIQTTEWSKKEKNNKDETVLLRNEKDDLKLQLKRTQEILEASTDSGQAAEQLVKLGNFLSTF